MKDYTSVSEKFTLSARMAKVHADILPRIQKWEDREKPIALSWMPAAEIRF